MPNDTEVVVPISADNKPLKNTLNETTNEIEKQSKKWDKAIEDSSNNMQKSFTKALDINRLKDWGIQAAKVMFDFGMQCVNAASDLQEVQNVVDTTFGQSASQIDAWAKTAITQFGLSETKAKQFASTLGAMMKSAGMAGDEVVKVSEDLAGLAADMSSFYNLDFDTAFQKIRSGLSGETEPLKQLGINMSQANLQAYALQKGITKTLDSMSQGEITMLRYQYLMQATADAQGDFAKTSDGYANSLRLLQSNLESIKTQIGTVFIDVLANATTSLNNFLTAINKPKQKTVLDEFAEINLNTDEKLRQLAATSQEAETLIGTLEGISSQVINYQQSGNLVTFIESLSGNITGLDDALTKAKEGDLNGAIDNLAEHLAQELGGDPTKWKDLLQAISNNAGAAIAATQGDSTKTKAFLENVAAGSDDLTTDYSTYWESLLKVLGTNAASAISALAGGDNTGSILEGIAGGANELKSGTGAKWKPFIDAIKGLNDAPNAPKSLAEIATALSTNLGGDAKKWENLLKAIGDNAGSAIAATSGDDGKTKDFLEKVAASADDLDTDYSTYWTNLLKALGDNAGAAIDALANGEGRATIVKDIAEGANELKSGTGFSWGVFVTSLSGLNNNKDVPETLQGIAKAFSEQLGGDPAKWENLLKAVGQNAKAAIDAVSGDAGKTKDFLQKVADGADDLTTDYSTYWSSLLQVLGTNAESAIKGLANATDPTAPGTVLSGIAAGANKLSIISPTVWNSLLGALTQVNGLSNIFNNTSAGKNVEDLANALSGNSPDVSKAEAWQTFLNALSENPDALTSLTKTSAEETAGWLSTMANAVNEIDPSDADAWNRLFANFVQGLPGLNDTEGGHAFFQTIAEEFLAMGNESEIAKQGLANLGLSTDQIDTAQKEWLETCKRLVQTIPGLNEIINTQTGEVNGGKQAIEDYYKTWKAEQEKQLLWDAYYQKQRVLNERKADEYRYQLEYMTAQARYNLLARRYKELGGYEAYDNLVGETHYVAPKFSYTEEEKELINIHKQLKDSETELINTYKAYTDEVNNNKVAEEDLALTYDALTESVGAYEDGMNGANQATDEGTSSFGRLADQADEVTKAIDATEKAVQALQNYTEQVYQSSLKSIEGTLGGFNSVKTLQDQAKEKMDDLTASLNKWNQENQKAGKTNPYVQQLEDAKNAIPSIQNLNEALQSQLDFLKEYQDNLAKMKALGYTDEVIAMVSGGSVQDASYAKALADTHKTDDNIRAINKKVSDINTKSKELAATMTDNNLKVDEEYKKLQTTAAEAIAGLDQYTEAKENVNHTMEGILEGLGDNAKQVQTQVDNILNMLAELSGASYNVNIPGVNIDIAGASGSSYTPIILQSNLTLDGKQVANSVSTHQAEQLTQMTRGGYTFTKSP